MIKFCATVEDHMLITCILWRAERLGMVRDRMASTMDIEACHCNGTPLDLAAWYAADDFNFVHDFFGIGRHIDRTTGELDGRFMPRFAVPMAARKPTP